MSSESNNIIKELQRRPESGYSLFVASCNKLADISENLHLVTNFLSSDSDHAASKVRRTLLHMDDDDLPTWDILYRARLLCDVKCPSIFYTDESNTRIDLSSIAAQRDQDSTKKNDDQAVVEYLEQVFQATILTLPSNYQKHKISFKQRSLFHLFDLDPQSTSIKLVQCSLRSIPFEKRQSLVREVCIFCHERKQWDVTTQAALAVRNAFWSSPSSDKPANKRKKNTTQSRTSKKMLKTITDKKESILKSYERVDREYIDIIRSIYTKHNTDLVISPTIQASPCRTDNLLHTRHPANANDTRERVQTIELVSGNSRSLVFSISPFLSATWRQDILDNLDRVPFMEGVAGRKGSYVRICTKDDVDQTFFQIGQKLYPSQHATECEMKLLDHINDLISIQNELLAVESTDSIKLYSTKVNTLQVVVEYITKTSGYALHSDFGALLNSRKDFANADSKEIDNQKRLPFREEMQTFTIVLTTGVDEEKETHALSFFDNNGIHVNSINTNGNIIHAQLHGSQTFDHKVDFINNCDFAKFSLRIVISARYTNPTGPAILRRIFGNAYNRLLLPRDSYKSVRVLQAMSIGKNPPVVNQFNHNPTNVYPTIKTTEVPIDHTNVCPHNDTIAICVNKLKMSKWIQADAKYMEEMNLHRRPSTLKSQSIPPWRFYSRYHVIRSLALSHGLIVSLDYRNTKLAVANSTAGNRNIIPTIYTDDDKDHESKKRILMPLKERVSEAALASMCNLSHSSRSHPPCVGDHKEKNTIVLSKPYKNDAQSIAVFVDIVLSSMFPERIQGHRVSTDCDVSVLPSITIYGSGGSPTNSDAFAIDLSISNKKQATRSVPSPQSIDTNAQNRTLVYLEDRQATVAVFLDLNEFLPFFPKDFTSLLGSVEEHDKIFLGYFYFDNSNAPQSMYLTPREFNQLISSMESSLSTMSKQKRDQFVEYSQFRMEKHLTFRLRPLFETWMEYERLEFRNQAEGYLEWFVDLSDDTEISTNLVDGAEINDSFPNESFINQFLCDHERDFVDYRVRAQQRGDFDFIAGEHLTIQQRIVQGTHVSDKREILIHLCMVTISVCLRYNKQNIAGRDNKQTTIGPLPPNVCTLSTIYRAHPFPMPVRTYDVIPLTLRACAFDLGILKTRGERVDRQLLTHDFLFMSILARLTGNPVPYIIFRNHCQPNHRALLPSPNQVDYFLNFVRVTGTHRLLFGSQHLATIPADMRSLEHVFCGIIKSIAEESVAIYEEMSPFAKDRLGAIGCLSRHLFRFTEEHKTNLRDRRSNDEKMRWLAHTIISDLEEIFVDPYGVATDDSVVCGHGAKQGWFVFFGERWKQISSPSDNRNLSQVTTWFCEALLAEDELSKLLRTALCLSIDQTSGRLVVSLNNRPVSSTDAEHFLCKLYVGALKTISSRSITKTPRSWSPGLHPIYSDSDSDLPWDHRVVSDIFGQAIRAYREAISSRAITHTPDSFLLLDEVDPLASTSL